MSLIYKGQTIADVGGSGGIGVDGNPIGTIISFMGTSAPKDYLICDGTEHNISQYQALARFFQKQFGTKNYFGGDGVSTFAVPDLRNLFLRGYHGDAETISGDIGVEQEGTIVPRYIFSGSQAVVYTDPNAASGLTTIQNPDETLSVSGCGRHEIEYDSSGTLESNPYGFSVRPVNMAVLYCIKAIESSSIGGSSSEEVYSTEETRIGTWIDGKPLYRKCIRTDNIIVGQNVVWANPPSDVKIIRYWSSVFGSGSDPNCVLWVPIDVPTNGNMSFYQNKLYYNCSNGDISGQVLISVVEYTKTTATGGAA